METKENLIHDTNVTTRQHTIYLNKDLSSWVTIEHLPVELKQYGSDNFDSMFYLHPENRGKVLVFNKDETNPEWNEIDCFRWSKSYLNTPKFDETVMKSYMFSGNNDNKPKSYMFAGNKDTNINDKLPEAFEPFYNYMKTIDNKNNQVIANWYNDNNDYMPFHSDCEANMVKNHTIAMINLNVNENDYPYRTFRIIPKDINDSLYNEVDIILRHGIVITMGGDTQTKFRHGVPKCYNENIGQRISLSFRQF